MRTRNSNYPNNSPVTIPRRRNRRHAPNVVELELRTIVEVAPMADNLTMEELLQAPTEGVNSTSRESSSKMDERIDKLADQILTLVEIVTKKVVIPATVKAVEESCVYYAACRAFDKLTPSISNGIYPVDTRAIQPAGFPFPLPILTSVGFPVIGRSARTLTHRFAPTIKNLLMNKDKLFELAKIPLNENCSAMLLKKLPENLGDPGKFLIPCDFPRMDTPTRMTLELADRSITRPKGLAEDVFVKVRKFHFPTDFVVVDFEADPRVPLILERSFLRTGRALIDVYREEITHRVNDEAVTFNLNQTTRSSSTYDDISVNRIDVIDVSCEEYSQEVLGFSNNSMGGNATSTFEPIISDSSLSFTPFEGSVILEDIEAYLKDDLISPEIDHVNFDLEGDICLIKKLLNNDPFQLPPMDLKQVTKEKSSIEEPPELELKDLPSLLEYAYLEGTNKLPLIIAKSLKDDEKEALLKCNALGTFQRCMMAIFHDMIEKTMEVFMDDFSIFRDSFSSCLSNLDKMLKRCEDTNLVLNWEKCHFMCREGIMLGHKISKFGIEVDRAKVDVIAKLRHPTTVKGVRSFLGHGGFYRRFIQDFSKIARPMTHLLEKETPFVFSKDCIDVFETLKKKFTEALILVVPDWNLPLELMCDASDFAIGAVLGQ
ncbi:reverse transcriptase domain-containing protein, partial [Tanacetum coccineum]